MFFWKLHDLGGCIFWVFNSSSVFVSWLENALLDTVQYWSTSAFSRGCFSISLSTVLARSIVKVYRLIVRAATTFGTCGSATNLWTALSTLLCKTELWKALAIEPLTTLRTTTITLVSGLDSDAPTRSPKSRSMASSTNAGILVNRSRTVSSEQSGEQDCVSKVL